MPREGASLLKYALRWERGSSGEYCLPPKYRPTQARVGTENALFWGTFYLELPPHPGAGCPPSTARVERGIRAILGYFLFRTTAPSYRGASSQMRGLDGEYAPLWEGFLSKYRLP